MEEKRLIYISETGSSVFESQVLELLEEIQKSNFFFEIILLIGAKKGEDNSKGLEMLKDTNIKINYFKLYPNYHVFKYVQKKELKNALSDKIDKEAVIHIRSEFLAQIIKQSIRKNNGAQIKILTDVRGAVYDETLLYKKFNPVLFQLKLYQHKTNMKLLSRGTDYISCVSSKLKNFVIQRTLIERNKVFVNSCLAGKNFLFSEKIRKDYRSKVGVEENEILFLFSTGGDGNWQNTASTVTNIANKGYKILNLSKKEIKHNNVINLFVPYLEVPKYLNAVDIAIVWRNNDIVNNVASPVKFSEYTCSGLPVIANDGVDLIKSYILDTGFGEIIDNFDNINSSLVEKLMKLDRYEISDSARKKYSSKLIATKYLTIYDKMLSE